MNSITSPGIFFSGGPLEPLNLGWFRISSMCSRMPADASKGVSGLRQLGHSTSCTVV
jgi:hypothetical protein